MLQTNVTGVCGEHWRCSGHTGFAPALSCVCFPRLHSSDSRLLCRERALCGVRFQVSGPPQKWGLGWAFCAFPALAAQAARSLTGALSLGAVPLIPSAGPASVSVRRSGAGTLCLFWGAGL